ncbi:Hypothetical predicted protein [Podarcis lilfordi]|uniref:Uncharacterized protein n=1 Tax=Podarcis lilfordi TaxID=74358 RepID=A0AA35L6W1_9SAUR|nr:Hypothetical predicted protein [Podarcis lilfordi]
MAALRPLGFVELVPSCFGSWPRSLRRTARKTPNLSIDSKHKSPPHLRGKKNVTGSMYWGKNEGFGCGIGEGPTHKIIIDFCVFESTNINKIGVKVEARKHTPQCSFLSSKDMYCTPLRYVYKAVISDKKKDTCELKSSQNFCIWLGGSGKCVRKKPNYFAYLFKQVAVF